MVKVKLEGITKYFGKVKAVDDVNLEIENEEFTVLLGPSGCGKTTTLRIIAGLETPTKGNVYFDGKLMNDVPPDKRNVAMVFQTGALYPHMKIFDNIAFCLRNRKMPREEVRKRVIMAMEMLEIQDLHDRFPHQLSGGQQQRVAIARAIVREPTIFLMDEPFANLDAKLRETCRSEIKKLHERIRGTFIFVTHDQIEAMTLAQKVAVMKDGRIQQVGSPEEIYNEPANDFVATFVGSPPMNIIEGALKADGEELEFICEDFRWTIQPGHDKKLKASEVDRREVKLGVRPTDVIIDKKGKIEAEIYMTELLGKEKKVTLKTRNNFIVSLTSKEFDVKTGQKVKFSFTQNLYVFDKKSGIRLDIMSP
jgi:ABC-type sugar transport system ATPase subunit